MISFNQPTIFGNELKYVKEAVGSLVISGEGHFIQKCEQYISHLLGGKSAVLLTPSCTHALEMSAMLLRIRDGDEVVMPSYTFVSTAAAFVIHGAKPVFVDIDPITLNIDPKGIRQRITDKTKAIVIVHYGGIMCDMDAIMAIAQEFDIPVIEDAAHALGSCYRGKPAGTFGNFSTFSFHETKNVTCGEGGALVINSADLMERGYVIRDKGTNRKKFQRGDVPFYTWVDLGSSFVMSDIQGAFLWGQLEHLEKINVHRRNLYQAYRDLLTPLKSKGNILFPQFPDISESAAHLFFILLENETVRRELQTYLRSHEINTVFHYQPLHLSPYVESRWGRQPELPITEDVSQRLLRLPMHNTLTMSEVDCVVKRIAEFFK